MAGFQQESPLTEASLSLYDTHPGSPSETDGHARQSKITRKSHKKSRAGCKNCKVRRVKCDEKQPECSNCKRRQVWCDYAGTQPPGLQSLSSSVLTEGLAIPDIELTFHWTTSTCHSLSAWSTGALHWQNVLSDIGLQNPHVLHLIFAFTAFHLAVCRPDRQAEYHTTADYHYERGLALVTPEIANLHPSNCDAVLSSVQLICFVNWARGPQPGEYLAFGEHGRSHWLAMFRGIRTTLDSIGRADFSKTHVPAVRSRNRPLPQATEPLGYAAQLEDLKAFVSAVSAPTAEREDDMHAVNVLSECYANRYQGRDGEYHVVFSWLYRMSDTFLDRLQLRQPLPLIVYAHFTVLMHEMERFWYMKGWTHHVISGIYDALPMEDRAWIRWPMTSVGWIAP